MNLHNLAQSLGITIEKNQPIAAVRIDSRKIQAGDLFVAIPGERFDGHDFIATAIAQGAVAVLCSRDPGPLPAGVTLLLVPDTMKALGQMAKAYRQTLAARIIALTGSNGKTSVKEMIAAILPSPAFATPGNLNNHLGVPLSVLQLKPEHQYAVFELGANHIGEIAYTVDIVQPIVSLINNIAPAHIEGFGSIDGVAKAKGEIYAGLPSGATAIINADDAYAHFWDPMLQDKAQWRFSIAQKADVYAEDIHYNAEGAATFRLCSPVGDATIRLQVPGEHNLRNALAASSAALALGISLSQIAAGLNAFTGVKGRLTMLRGKAESRVIDDTYNANLRSVQAALRVLSQYQGKKIFVFGDMGELGEHARDQHQAVGQTAKELGIDQVYTCGRHSAETSASFGPKAQHYLDKTDLIQALLPEIQPGTTILVKGSRSAAMEQVVQAIIA